MELGRYALPFCERDPDDGGVVSPVIGVKCKAKDIVPRITHLRAFEAAMLWKVAFEYGPDLGFAHARPNLVDGTYRWFDRAEFDERKHQHEEDKCTWRKKEDLAPPDSKRHRAGSDTERDEDQLK